MSKFADYTPGRGDRSALSAADGLAIRPARASDLDTIAAIAAEREGEEIEPWRAAFDRFHAESGAGRALVLVAELPGEIAAYGKASLFVPRPDFPPNVAPEGWYLTGVVVRPAHRRRGLGTQLTRMRLAWIAERADRAYYFANSRNQVSIELHRRFGFEELTRDFYHPHARFDAGVGILFACGLERAPAPSIAFGEGPGGAGI
jgi:ribosomal protein S18 acetylase RimI-like enzyme